MKKILAVILVLGISLMITSCGSQGNTDTNYAEQVANLQRENALMAEIIKEDEEKIKSLEDTIAALTGGEVRAAITSIEKGSNVKTFNSINGATWFITPFEYKGSTLAPSTSKLYITDKVMLVPSSNWIIKMQGSSVEFNHHSGIIGIIKVGTIEEVIPPEQIQGSIFQPFINNIPSDKVVYGDIFINERCWGKYANINTTIDAQPATLKAGAIGYGGISVTYMFGYDTEYDATKNELIDTLLKTLKINNQDISYN